MSYKWTEFVFPKVFPKLVISLSPLSLKYYTNKSWWRAIERLRARKFPRFFPHFWKVLKNSWILWTSFYMRNIALKFFSLGCSSFSRNDVCKTGTPLVKTECFFFCILNVLTTNWTCWTYLNKKCIRNLERFR